jgi:hypothetical protein
MKKNIAAVIFLGVFLILKAEASVISFYVIETGLPQNAGINRHSLLWEDTFMDVFFDSGYIVSNYPMMRFPACQEGNIQDISGFDVFEAIDASVDFILIAKLDFPSAINPPEIISFYLFRVKQHEIIYEKQISGKRYGSDKDARADMRKTIRELVQFVYNLS